MSRVRSVTQRVVWLPVFAIVLMVAVWLVSTGGQKSASADEQQKLYLSSSSGLTIAGVRYEDEDILVLDTSTGKWQLFFDGSALGLAAVDIDALEIQTDGALLLSLDQYTTAVPGMGEVSDADILHFEPNSPGDYSAGAFSMYVDGSDVGLTTSGEDIDAIALAGNGDLLISTFGAAKVPMGSGTLTVRDADMMKLTLTQSGDNTIGTWELYFDGSDVELTTTGEDIRSAWLDQTNGALFLSTYQAFGVGALSGARSDIFVCQALVSGDNTSCDFGTNLFWRGTDTSFGSRLIDALAISGYLETSPTSTPSPGATSTPPPGATATPTATLTATPTATPPPGSPTATPRPENPSNTELLMYDWTKPVTVGEKGMPRDRPPMASANGDWTNPRNFAQGTMHFRVEFFSMPVAKRMQVQFCVWQDDWTREQCADRSNVFLGTRGTVVTWSEPIATMWKLPGSEPIDWTRERMIWGYVIRTEDGKPVHPKFNWSGQNTDEWFPLYWRATAVVVEKGATFGGWNNYIP